MSVMDVRHESKSMTVIETTYCTYHFIGPNMFCIVFIPNSNLRNMGVVRLVT